jgi:hypothetical protein
VLSGNATQQTFRVGGPVQFAAVEVRKVDSRPAPFFGRQGLFDDLLVLERRG